MTRFRCWLDWHNVAHIVDDQDPNYYTWCDVETRELFAGKFYQGKTADVAPTCLLCIANVFDFETRKRK